MKTYKHQLNLSFLFIITFFLFQCSSSVESAKDDSEYPLLETMGYYQRFSHKLWLAGEKQNWELAEFYAHELHEVTEELIESNVMHDAQNLSDMAESIIEKNVQNLITAIDKKDQVIFRESYEVVVASCNVCHIKTEHPFIKIIVPTDSLLFNQQF